MAAKDQDQEFVEYLIKTIVDHPDDVSTDRKVDEMGVLITLKVNPEDMGQVIGRSGQNARAIRTLLRVVGAKNNARVNLKIEEPEGGRPEGGRPEGPRSPATDRTSAPAPDSISDEAVDDLKL